ncbi:MAG: EF-hand domain-containing protein [Kiritimatiellae bacterium]|nr:EF-hand domain-containing protein [Kiritimatiellia bacterium]
MKTPVYLLSVALFAATQLHAEEQTKEKWQPPQEPWAEKVFAKIDTNGDGGHSLAEMIDHLKKEWAKKGKTSGLEKEARTRFKNRDLDGDGAVSLKEFGIPSQVFWRVLTLKQSDTDKDGALSTAELTAMVKSQYEKQGKSGYEAEAARRLKYLDKDKSGSVSLEEYAANAVKKWKQALANKKK